MGYPVGERIDRYIVLELIGEGGMAGVFKAHDTRLEADVAIKIIHTESLPQNALERALKRFEREAKALARLNHPNIVKVTDYGEHAGKPYLVMPYFPSGTLKSRMGRPLPWRDAVRLLIPIARALEYAHEKNIIHRDVKPSNILLTDQGQPMLSDFGIVRVIGDDATLDLTGTSGTVGTPEYSSPEQSLGKVVDHRTDIYSLGIALYELVTGRKPFQGDTPQETAFKHYSEPLPSPRKFVRDLPASVEQVLVRALAKDPKDRYPDMRSFAAALEKLVEGLAVRAPFVAPAPPSKPERPVQAPKAAPRPVPAPPAKTPALRASARPFQRGWLWGGGAAFLGVAAVLIWFASSSGNVPLAAAPSSTAALAQVATEAIAPIPSPTSPPANTPSPTSTSTGLPSTKAGLVLFEDDFESGLARGWLGLNNGPGCAFGPFRDGSGRMVGLVRGGCSWVIRPTGAEHWKDYAVSFRLKINRISTTSSPRVDNSLRIAVRADNGISSGCSEFTTRFYYPSTVIMQSMYAGAHDATAACYGDYIKIKKAVSKGDWNNYRWEILDKDVWFYMNNVLIRHLKDVAGMPGEGYVQLSTPPDSEFYIDDVEIVELLK